MHELPHFVRGCAYRRCRRDRRRIRNLRPGVGARRAQLSGTSGPRSRRCGRGRTIAELNVPVSQRIEQIRINLDRGRVLLQDLPDEFVVVNVAGYQVFLVRGREVIWKSRVQVGKPYRRTPIFRSQITYLVFNPTWTVPPGIIANDILPDARRDPASITRRGLRVLNRAGEKSILPRSTGVCFARETFPIRCVRIPVRKCARPREIHVPQRLCGLSARHTFYEPVRCSGSQLQFGMRSRREPAAVCTPAA